MILKCDNCGKEYQMDINKIPQNVHSAKCKICGSSIPIIIKQENPVNTKIRRPFYLHPAIFVAIIFSTLIIGYFIGREHVKYEIKKSITNGIKDFSKTISGASNNNTPITKKSDFRNPIYQSIPIIIVDKGFEEGDYNSYITVTFEFHNKLKKEIRAFEGSTEFYDILGNLISKVSYKHQEIVRPDQIFVYKGVIEYNKFSDSDNELRSTDIKNLAVKFALKKVLYLDGTTEEF